MILGGVLLKSYKKGEIWFVLSMEATTSVHIIIVSVLSKC